MTRWSPLREGDRSVNGMQRPFALMDEDHLIRPGILEKVSVHAFPRCGQADVEVAVDQHRHAAFQVIVGGLHAESEETPVLHVLFDGDLGCDGINGRIDLRHQRRAGGCGRSANRCRRILRC